MGGNQPGRQVWGELRSLVEALADAPSVLSLLDDLRRRELLLQRLCDAFPGWLVVLDAEGRFRAMSARFAASLGVSPEDALGRRCDELRPECGRACLEALAAFERGEPGLLGHTERHGEVTWSVDRLPIRDEGKRLVGLLFMARPVDGEARATLPAASPQRAQYFAHLRRLLIGKGFKGSTLVAAEALLLHILPLFAGAGTWRGQVREISELCGRSGTAVRRSIRVLGDAGILGVRRRGPAGLELSLRVLPVDVRP